VQGVVGPDSDVGASVVEQTVHDCRFGGVDVDVANRAGLHDLLDGAFRD
jgi:hypothetical protein